MWISRASSVFLSKKSSIAYPLTMWLVAICGVVGMTFIGVGSQEPADLQMQLIGGMFIFAAVVLLMTTSTRNKDN
jgi:hypothetical protein